MPGNLVSHCEGVDGSPEAEEGVTCLIIRSALPEGVAHQCWVGT